jgi:O-antigen biosynthesis protein WbqP
VLDILFLLVFFPLWFPVMGLLALAVKLSSKGPVFFRQKRVGKDKTFFMIYKFRSMYTDAPKDVPTHLLENPAAFITPVGRFLRKSSLDELPQLFNILKGELTLVGPRPALWNQDDLVAEREKYGANALVPGLTGLAQVKGRDELPIPVKARYDGEYGEKLSLLLDIKILFMTFFAVFRSSGVVEGGTGAMEKSDDGVEP